MCASLLTPQRYRLYTVLIQNADPMSAGRCSNHVDGDGHAEDDQISGLLATGRCPASASLLPMFSPAHSSLRTKKMLLGSRSWGRWRRSPPDASDSVLGSRARKTVCHEVHEVHEMPFARHSRTRTEMRRFGATPSPGHVQSSRLTVLAMRKGYEEPLWHPRFPKMSTWFRKAGRPPRPTTAMK